MTKRQAYKIVKRESINVSLFNSGSIIWRWMSRSERTALAKAGKIERRAWRRRVAKSSLR